MQRTDRNARRAAPACCEKSMKHTIPSLMFHCCFAFRWDDDADPELIKKYEEQQPYAVRRRMKRVLRFQNKVYANGTKVAEARYETPSESEEVGRRGIDRSLSLKKCARDCACKHTRARTHTHEYALSLYLLLAHEYRQSSISPTGKQASERTHTYAKTIDSKTYKGRSETLSDSVERFCVQQRSWGLKQTNVQEKATITQVNENFVRVWTEIFPHRHRCTP